MALFRIFKGNKNKLGVAPSAGEQDTRYAHEGFAYFTPDDGKFYIDIAGNTGDTNTPAVIGTNRIPLSANRADKDRLDRLIDETYAKRSNSVYYVLGDGSGSAGNWTGTIDSEVTELYDGLTIIFCPQKAGVSNSTNRTLTNDDSTTVSLRHTCLKLLGVWKPVYYQQYNANNQTDNRLTTHYGANAMIIMTYRTAANGGTGGWVAGADYNSDQPNYRQLDIYFRPYASTDPIYRYKICALDKDNRLVPLTITNQTSGTNIDKTQTTLSFKPDQFWLYYSTTTTAAGAVVPAQILYRMFGDWTTPQYTFNTTIPAYTLTYLKGSFDSSTNLFTLDQTSHTSWQINVPTNTANLTLSNYFTTDSYYILMGGSYSSNNYFCFFENNPMYYFDGTNLIPIVCTAERAKKDSLGNNIVNTYLTKAAGITNIAWDNTNKKLTKTINGTTTDVVAVTVNNPTLAWNTESTVAKIGTVDVKVKLPANPNTNTDTLVKQTAKSDNKNYKILFTTSDSPTSGGAAEAAYDTGVTINPSTHTLTATNLKGILSTQDLKRPTGLRGLNDVTLQALVNNTRANHLAFLPADQIIIEKTTDGGVTWVDAGVSDATKLALFSEKRPNVTIPMLNGARSLSCGLRITITAMKYNVPDGTPETEKYNYWNATYVKSQERYCQLKDMYFWLTAVNDSIGVTVQRATGANSNTWVNIFNDTSYFMTGWSGCNYINFSQNTFGGGTNQTGNYWNYRIILMTKGTNGTTTMATSSTTSAQSIMEIRGYGDTVWGVANNYMAYDHIYNFDANQNVTFPKQVTATKFIGPLQGNADTATSAGKLQNTTKIGDTNKPVYFTANGVPAAINYTIDKSVPSNAVFTDTATAVDNILDGSNAGTAITYAPYSSQQTKLSFDTSSTNPSRTDRLNLNGYLYATKLYSEGTEVKVKQTAINSATAETTTATTFVYSVTQDTNGVITVKTRPLPTYNNYSLPLAASGTRGGIQIGYTQSGKNYPVQLSSEKAYVNVPWTDTWKANSSSSEGYVASGSGKANKVWKTDANGNPAWRDDDNTTYTTTTTDVIKTVTFTAGSAPTLGAPFSVPNVTGNTSVTASNITAQTDNVFVKTISQANSTSTTIGSVNDGVLTLISQAITAVGAVTAGSTATASAITAEPVTASAVTLGTEFTIPHVTAVGSVPTLSTTTQNVVTSISAS